tara:strand:- start:27 stop:341 length:315 start_codon:yes stop_codon:yes gene_type:complete
MENDSTMYEELLDISQKCLSCENDFGGRIFSCKNCCNLNCGNENTCCISFPDKDNSKFIICNFCYNEINAKLLNGEPYLEESNKNKLKELQMSIEKTSYKVIEN